MLFAYVLLVDFKRPLPEGPAVSEYVLYFWVFTIVCEEIREVSERTSLFSQTRKKHKGINKTVDNRKNLDQLMDLVSFLRLTDGLFGDDVLAPKAEELHSGRVE